MFADAHIHLVDLAEKDASFPEKLPASGWTACAACHDEAEYHAQSELLGLIPPVLRSFGIHPQWPVWQNADFLAKLAASGQLDAIGEAGFDFFGDTPERVRNEENSRTQRGVFEFQLGLARTHGLPMVLHFRKSMDLAFAYAKDLASLRSVVFHCFSGTAEDAESLLRHGIEAWFSFGTPLLKGNKRAARSCALLPEERLLSETDAPWQAPRGSPWSGAGLIVDVVAAMARLRGMECAALGDVVELNFRRAYGSEGD
jgi:TatD DNase family protein